jgi:hypothetical protein
MVLRDGWRGIHRKVDRVGRVLRGPSDKCSASFRAGHRRARLPRTLHTRTWVNTLTFLSKETGIDAFLVERLDKLPHHPADRGDGYARGALDRPTVLAVVNPSCPLQALNGESQQKADDLQLEALRRYRMYLAGEQAAQFPEDRLDILADGLA